VLEKKVMFSKEQECKRTETGEKNCGSLTLICFGPWPAAVRGGSKRIITEKAPSKEWLKDVPADFSFGQRETRDARCNLLI